MMVSRHHFQNVDFIYFTSHYGLGSYRNHTIVLCYLLKEVLFEWEKDCCHFYPAEKEISFLNDCCLKVVRFLWS